MALSEYNRFEFNILLSDKPSPPRNLHSTEVYSDYIVVAWEVPESDGGAPITGYMVERRSENKNTWIKVKNNQIPVLFGS